MENDFWKLNSGAVQPDVRWVLAFAGLTSLFSYLFLVLSLVQDSSPSSEKAERVRIAKDLALPAVPASAAFRATVQDWCGFTVSQQIEAIDDLRHRLSHNGWKTPDDLTCLRFLRARRLHQEKTLEMYECYCGWHATNVAGVHVESSAEVQVGDHKRQADAKVGGRKRQAGDMDEILRRYYPASIIGRDQKGRPVKFMDLGQLDMAFLRQQGITDSHVLDFHVREMETLARCLSLRDESTAEARAAWKNPDVDPSLHAIDPLLGCVIIFETHNCTYGKFISAFSVWRTIGNIDQNNYPEMLGQALFVRPPRLLRWAWNIFKQFVDERTVAKFEIIDGDPYDRIAELVGPESVPTLYQRKTSAEPPSKFSEHVASQKCVEQKQQAISPARNWAGCLPIRTCLGHRAR